MVPLRLIASACVLLALTGCGVAGYQVVMRNVSRVPVIIRVSERAEVYGHRYHALPPGVSVLVDTTGHNNPTPDAIEILAPDCSLIRALGGTDFAEGAVLTITDPEEEAEWDPGPAIPYAPRCMAGPDPWEVARSTCEEAARDLSSN